MPAGNGVLLKISLFSPIMILCVCRRQKRKALTGSSYIISVLATWMLLFF